MKVERFGPTQYGDATIPPRLFVELSTDEVRDAVRQYVEQKGQPLPTGRLMLRFPDDYIKSQVFTLMVEDPADMREAQAG